MLIAQGEGGSGIASRFFSVPHLRHDGRGRVRVLPQGPRSPAPEDLSPEGSMRILAKLERALRAERRRGPLELRAQPPPWSVECL
jgi:hypothetical protein